MLNEFERLKNELSVLYPGVTDIELPEMTDNLIKFFMVVIKNIYKTKNIMTSASTSSEIPDGKSLINRKISKILAKKSSETENNCVHSQKDAA